MGLLILILIIVHFSSSKKKQRNSDASRSLFKILGVLFGLSLLTTLLNSFGGGTILLAIAVFFFVRYMKKEKDGAEYTTRSTGDRETSTQRNWNSTMQNRKKDWNSYNTYSSSVSTNLPYPKKKRMEIVERFNEAYGLTLNEEEMATIVDASYLSDDWKKEIIAMNRRYESMLEWLGGDTAPIRVYMQAFNLQSISSDFSRQWQITESAFMEVMAYADSLRGFTYEQRLQKVNDHFFTSFNDATFMIAYRYLQSRGHYYDIGSSYVPKDQDLDLEERMQRYEI